MPETPVTQWYLKIPPPGWTLAMLAIAYGVERHVAGAAAIWFYSIPLAIFFGAAGFAAAAWAVLFFLAEGTEIEPASKTNKKVVIGGPFRLTRNPMYFGLVLMTVGIAFYFGTLPFFAVPVFVFLLCNLVFIPFEEAKMQHQHGAPYTEYRTRVRRWI